MTQNLNRIEKITLIRKRNTEHRHERIRARFNHLYNIERKRYDDVLSIVCEEFGLAQRTIESIMKG